MAFRDHPSHHHHHPLKKSLPPSSPCSSSTSFLLSLLSLASLFLAFSLFKTFSSAKSSLSPHHQKNFEFNPTSDSSQTNIKSADGHCDYLDGKWIYDPKAGSGRYDHICKEIYKGWNCIGSRKSNALDIVKWRWKPNHCELPQFDPLRFLQRYRHTNFGFIGDSLNRNMFVSLFCTLKQVSGEVRKWRPSGADRGYTFVQHNLTIAYHRTNLLARYGRWSASTTGGVLESLGYKEGYRVDVDIPDGTWADALSFHDVLIFNTGHWWWAPSKFDPVKSPMLFFEKSLPVMPPVPHAVGLDMVLKHMTSFVKRSIRPTAIIFFRTQSPRHFEGGDWDQGGSCRRINPLSPQEVEKLFSLQENGTNMEARLVNQYLNKALDRAVFNVLDITRMSEFRADAHPSVAGGKKHDDCMHWCLPGITDTWNDLFIANLNIIKRRN